MLCGGKGDTASGSTSAGVGICQVSSAVCNSIEDVEGGEVNRDGEGGEGGGGEGRKERGGKLTCNPCVEFAAHETNRVYCLSQELVRTCTR